MLVSAVEQPLEVLSPSVNLYLVQISNNPQCPLTTVTEDVEPNKYVLHARYNRISCTIW